METKKQNYTLPIIVMIFLFGYDLIRDESGITYG